MVISLISVFANLTIASFPEALPLHSASHPMDIAVIGAGASGASAAYFLHQYASEANLPVNVTIYERNSYVGGRSTTVNAYGDPDYPVELGASIFVDVNHILVNASKAFNLTTTSFGPTAANIDAPSLGIWDGQSFVLTLAASGPSWWDAAKLLFRYGLSPVRTRNLMKSTVGKFLTMYDAPVFPFSSLTSGVADVDLLSATSISGERYLLDNSISPAFAHDVVQASTRVNYAQNLGRFHGLETMVCMATDGAMAVDGGNWQIFDRMISASTATLYLNTTVTNISSNSKGGWNLGSHNKREFDSKALSSHFDAVILATPIDFADMSIDAGMIGTPAKTEYVKLHVTLFTSPRLPDPKQFRMTRQNVIPRTILTTTNCEDMPSSSCFRHDSQAPWFFSISVLSTVESPITGATEYLYKIFSHDRVNDAKLGAFFEADFRDSDDGLQHVTWLHRKEWLSYPYEYPRSKFDDIEIGSDLWYTGSMDTFISTMETNALMGKNVARLIVDKAQGRSMSQLQGSKHQAILAAAL